MKRHNCWQCRDTGRVETQRYFPATKYQPAGTLLSDAPCPRFAEAEHGDRPMTARPLSRPSPAPGGAAPGIVGNDLVRAVVNALGCLPGVTITRNPVMRVRLPSGGYAWTGIGGEGAPDLHVEIMTPGGITCCAWFECKNGEHAVLSKVQRAWHAAAEKMGRHIYVVRRVEDALAVVQAFQMGKVVRP